MISFTLLRASQMFKASYGGLQAGGDRDRQSVGFRLDDVLSERGTVSCTAGRLIGQPLVFGTLPVVFWLRYPAPRSSTSSWKIARPTPALDRLAPEKWKFPKNCPHRYVYADRVGFLGASMVCGCWPPSVTTTCADVLRAIAMDYRQVNVGVPDSTLFVSSRSHPSQMIVTCWFFVW